MAVEKIGRALAECVAFAYTGGVVELSKYLRELPRPESRIAWVGLACAASVVVATPLIAGLAPQLPLAVFEDARGRPQSVPGAAVAFTLAALSAAWGYILSGAAQGPGFCGSSRLWCMSSRPGIETGGRQAVREQVLHAGLDRSSWARRVRAASSRTARATSCPIP